MNEKIKIPYFKGGVKSSRPSGNFTLNEFILHIRLSAEGDQKRYEEIKRASAAGNMQMKNELKQKDWFCTPAVQLTHGRKYSNIERFNGLMVLDFDKLGSELLAHRFKKMVFDIPEIIASWTSVSGLGVRALVKIPICKSVDEYKQYFWGFKKEYFNEDPFFDIAPQNPVLPLFMSHDNSMKIRDCAIPWFEKADNPKKRIIDVTKYYDPDVVTKDIYGKWSLANATQAINKITDNGHPQVRAAAYTLGGRVAANYIEFGVAENHLHGLIKSNAYLSKGISGYCTTATQMLKDGMNYPLIFDEK